MPVNPPSTASTKTVLIIEDDKAIINAESTLLKHYEFVVSVASTIVEGRQAIQRRPDLVILDLNLPDGDGLQLLEQLRKAGNATPVFILTGDESADTLRRARRWMPDGYFHKPLNFIEILQAIRKKLTPDEFGNAA